MRLALASILVASSALAHEDRFPARVLSVYDGDTIRAQIELGLGVVLSNEQLRLHGIDAPEVRGDERAEGLVVRDWLHGQVQGADVTLATHGRDKFGRILVTVYLGSRNINEEMLAAGLVGEYTP